MLRSPRNLNAHAHAHANADTDAMPPLLPFSLSLSVKTHACDKSHLSLHLREGVAQFPELAVAVGIEAEQAVEQLETVGAGCLHQSQRAREALSVDGCPRKPLLGCGTCGVFVMSYTDDAMEHKKTKEGLHYCC